MFILDNPYVSDVLLKTVEELRIPVLENEMIKEVIGDYHIESINRDEFLKNYHEEKKIYTNSENSLEWLYKNIPSDKKIQTIQQFKNKAEFRKLIKEVYPDFFFERVKYKDLRDVEIENIKLPVVLKPNQGFFSLGVYIIYQKSDWERALREIDVLMKEDNHSYNDEVINHAEYIIEEYAEGQEYAVDGYYDADGNVVILNVLKHVFADERDVLDRLYVTNVEIVRELKTPLADILDRINCRKEIKNFPFHFEVKIDGERIVPIEMNPMRFAGWCTTDIGFYSYGINTYKHFFENTEPNWDEIYADNEGVTYAMVIMGKTKQEVVDMVFDYDKLVEEYSEIIECRKVDYNRHSIYGFLFLKMTSFVEKQMNQILHEDFDRFLIT